MRKIISHTYHSHFSKMAAAAAFSTVSCPTQNQNPTSPSLLNFSSPKLASFNSPIHPFKSLKLNRYARSVIASAAAPSATSAATTTFHGLCYVVGDNIDTDQIIPAEYLTLVPSNPDEYEKLGSYALIGLPASYQTRFIDPGETKTKYSIVIGGDNFGCGSSREHAPVALGAAGVAAVVAESYARIFFRNSVATGEVYPLESEGRLCEECKTGDVVTIEMGESDDCKLINHTSGKEFKLKPIGDAGPVIEAGGIFAYARKAGMIPSRVA
ncbi:Plasma membrane sulfite pump involved in sulfite metabolism [Castilleja foliolosa]|uniref:3-isopropylmalate dehydratase n=1 Tax=Castilleja foliolosa TaxID=1961234 RepID=A0ABD3C9K5_9LAMI